MVYTTFNRTGENGELCALVYLPLVKVIRQKVELAQITLLTRTEQRTINTLAVAHSGARVTTEGTVASSPKTPLSSTDWPFQGFKVGTCG